MKSFRVLSFSLNLSLFTIDLMFDGIIFFLISSSSFFLFVKQFFDLIQKRLGSLWPQRVSLCVCMTSFPNCFHGNNLSD